MNVTELSRQLKIRTDELLRVLPEFGFDIGRKAVKVDDRVALQIRRAWPRIQKELERRRLKEAEEKKALEREMRKSSGATVELPAVITVKNFAEKLQLPITKIISELFKNGILASQNENIDHDTASIIAEELGFTVKSAVGASDTHAHAEPTELIAALEKDKDHAELEPRPPVIVVMGHVDHGKTTLLDSIRRANVASGEAGGITQHIGAYQVLWKTKDKKEQKITFIDTPGHEAFTVMRSRGAKVADIAILVVAADDGVKPQTAEVIQILKAAKIPFVVAINKIDKEGANPDKVRQELASQYNILSEEWGGDVPMIPISAKSKLNIDKLLDVLILVAELQADKLRARVKRPALGTIVEAHIDKGAGPVATILVQSGTLKPGDQLVVNGEIYGKVRAMKDYTGADVKEATPSTPVRILGFKVAPGVGDILDVARGDTAEKIDVKSKVVEGKSAQKSYKHVLSQSEDAEGKKFLPVLIKADTLGSLEAILASLAKMVHPEVGVKVIAKGLGNVSESEAERAEATHAFVFGFNVQAAPSAEEYMRSKHVPFEQYSIIYDLINFIQAELEKLLNPEHITKELGAATVLALFKNDKKVKIVGARVENGRITKDAKVKLVRKGETIEEGKVLDVRIEKNSVKEVKSGTECGISVSFKEVPAVGDTLQVFESEERARKLLFEKS